MLPPGNDLGRIVMLRRALAFAVPLGIAAQAVAQTDGRREAEAVLAKLAESYNRKDSTALAALFTEDAILARPGAILTGRQAIEQDYRTRFEQGFTGFTVEVKHAHAEGDGVWTVAEYSLTHPAARRGNVTDIYRRQGNGLLIRVHSFNFQP